MIDVRKFIIILFVLTAAAVGWWIWHGRPAQSTPQQQAAESLREMIVALSSPDPQHLLQLVALPEAIRGRTPSEQFEFLRKALVDEISVAGIQVLANEGQFGSLLDVFPDQAVNWARQAGVNPTNCIAFRLERNGIVAEVAIATNPVPPRIVRCNNVKQLAGK